MLPDIHGYEVLRRSRDPRDKTLILILTGLSDLEAKGKRPRLRCQRLPDETLQET